MKLLMEDQKIFVNSLENNLDCYQKLWKQYEESTPNVMALNKLYQDNLLTTYFNILSQMGWK
jgi:hypothetical protein